MSIKKNPFAVGYSGEGAEVTGQRRCECCRLPGEFRYNRTTPDDPVWCATCTSHKASANDSVEAQLLRSEAHLSVVWERAEAAGRRAAEARRDVSRLREQVGAALSDRDYTFDTLRAVAELHVLGPKLCSCGLSNCETEALLSRGSVGRRLGRSMGRNPF